MATFAVQYLGSRPKDAAPAEVRKRLREAFDRLPISMVLLDWDLPPALEDAVAEETRLHGAKLYRWQTWLTADANTDLPPEWSVVALNGNFISGYANDPDFTFICPNRTAVIEFLAERMEAIAARGLFQGIFLDRIRFPSPAADPFANLGCFCRHCARLAADRGLDLPAARQHVQSLLVDKNGTLSVCRSLLGHPDDPASPLEQVLDFRQESINRAVKLAREQARTLGLAVGLDCFSPALTRMVGQDLKSLGNCSDWVKIMTYPRVFGPAGISFELYQLLDWLISCGWSEPEGLEILRSSSGLALPVSRVALRLEGLGPDTITREIQRAFAQGLAPLLAGIALVEVKGVHDSTPAQIQADLIASRTAEGLVLSWDLWQIPLETLNLVQRIWEIQ